MASVRLITDASQWDSFVQASLHTLFVQSPLYVNFYKSLGEEGFISGIFNDDDVLIGGAVVVTVHAKRGNFLYVPYGPLLPEQGRRGAFQAWVAYLKDFGAKNGYDFLRVSPFLSTTRETVALFERELFRPAPMHTLAETTWLLDITPPSEALLAQMNKNHRNLIRRCLKEGVRVDISTDGVALNDFNRLHDLTASRHKFTRFSKEYIEKEFQAFAASGNAAVLRAYLPNGQLDAAAIILFYGTMACYRHGASINLDHKIPTSYLIQWVAIEEAKRRGSVWYNFWGIAPKNASKSHPFFGITHFKTGFGGTQVDLVHCQDLPLTYRYYINWLVESLRRIKRGF